MKKTIRTYLLATAMGALAVAPAATVATFGSTSAAYAKSENGKGGGNGGGAGKSSGQSAKGNKGGNASNKGGNASNKGGGNGKAASRSTGGDPVGDFFRKLTGQEKKASRMETRSAGASGKPAKGSGMHPSELGNMNGALHANMNAVLAHIRNGNTNGPVGHLAALAVAGAGAEGKQEIVDLAGKFQTLDDALLNPEGTYGEYSFASLEDYLAAKAGTPGVSNGLIDAKLQELADLPVDEDDATLIAELNALLEGAGYGGEGYVGDPLEDYLADAAGVPGIDPIGPVEDAIAALQDSEGMIPEEPDPEAVAEAEGAIAEKGAAESSILAYWNKNDDNPEEITDAEQALLDKLYGRLVGYEDAIAGAMASAEAKTATEGEESTEEELGEETPVCEGPDPCEEPEELAAVE